MPSGRTGRFAVKGAAKRNNNLLDVHNTIVTKLKIITYKHKKTSRIPNGPADTGVVTLTKNNRNIADIKPSVTIILPIIYVYYTIQIKKAYRAINYIVKVATSATDK